MNSTWCYAHKRYEDSVDYIDFPTSPTFLGAFYEMGITQRRPFEGRPEPVEEQGLPVRGDEEYARMFQDMRNEIEKLRRDIRRLQMPAPARPTSEPTQRQQREINVDRSGD
jgi:hypothetical protein